MIAKIDHLTASFHFHPAINNIVDNKKNYASMEDLTQVPSNAQYWGSYTGFNNRPRKAEGYYELPANPVSIIIIYIDDNDDDDNDDNHNDDNADDDPTQSFCMIG